MGRWLFFLGLFNDCLSSAHVYSDKDMLSMKDQFGRRYLSLVVGAT